MSYSTKQRATAIAMLQAHWQDGVRSQYNRREVEWIENTFQIPSGHVGNLDSALLKISGLWEEYNQKDFNNWNQFFAWINEQKAF